MQQCDTLRQFSERMELYCQQTIPAEGVHLSFIRKGGVTAEEREPRVSLPGISNAALPSPYHAEECVLSFRLTRALHHTLQTPNKYAAITSRALY
ncbi:hypothetical protein AAFF_G00396210 [Aldrovandia affinis]|uniref:Uncharacterized protein n=1 Tax=Aldrovandia affinis TaxID=143900 RepID=A0AAD7WKR3_9TELE|nr:hypothetical protein AAFF_G00396210 [Aldrovandia affinis]